MRTDEDYRTKAALSIVASSMEVEILWLDSYKFLSIPENIQQ